MIQKKIFRFLLVFILGLALGINIVSVAVQAFANEINIQDVAIGFSLGLFTVAIVIELTLGLIDKENNNGKKNR